MGDLKDWADKQSPYIKLADGESFTGQYLGFKEITGKFGKAIRYSFVVDGEEKYFEKSSMGFAYNMDKIEPDSWIRVTRSGEGNKSTYEVEPVAEEEAPKKEDKVDVDSIPF